MNAIPRKKLILAAVAACLVLIAAQLAAAQERIDKRLRAAPDGSVEIENVAGTVQVIGWNNEEIQVTGTLGRNVERLDFTVDGRRARIKVVLPHNAHDTGDTDLRISLPRASRVQANTVSAGIGVEEVTGELELQTVSGEVTVSGRRGGADIQTVSGDIKISAGAPRTHAQTVSGHVTLEAMSGDVDVSTVSGDAHIHGNHLDRLHAQSVSGNLICGAEPTPDGSLSLDSHSGNIEIELPADTNADFKIGTFSGEIESAFGSAPQSVRSHGHGPGKELSFTTGSGGANVEIQTFSGDVTLKKR